MPDGGHASPDRSTVRLGPRMRSVGGWSCSEFLSAYGTCFRHEARTMSVWRILPPCPNYRLLPEDDCAGRFSIFASAGHRELDRNMRNE